MATLPLAMVAAMSREPVFPCAADKRPLTPHGFKDATLDPQRIAELFADPRAALIGMPTGRASNLIAVDIDVKDGAGGEAWLDANRHRLPATLTHRTRSGGWHLLFRPPAEIEVRNSAGKLAPGVDVRGEGGFIIVPPSPGYGVERDAEPAELPDWLLDDLRPAPTPERPTIPRSAPNGRDDAYVRAALDAECDAIRAAAFGTQEATLNRAAVKIGGYVVTGYLSLSLAKAELAAAAEQMPNQPGRPRWTPGEIDRKVRAGLAAGERQPKHPPEPQADHSPAAGIVAGLAASTELFRDAGEFGDVEPPEREWIVPDWLPAGEVTLLYANGGEGKSLLALQLGAACAVGRPWLGLQAKSCRVMVLACEDDADELHRRLFRINADLGIGMGDLAGRLRVATPRGEDNTLVRFGRDGAPIWTERFRQVHASAIDYRPGVIVLDTSADLFGGNENDRAQVSAFLKAGLGRLARDTGAAVLLLAHPSRAGMASGGDLDGGSTAWNGAVRSRWSLVTPTDAGGQPSDPSVRVLARRKANYAVRGGEIRMRFRAGVLVRDGYTRGSADLGRPTADATFLHLLDRMTAAGDRFSTSPNSGRYAPRVFARLPDCAGYGKRELEAAMHRLMRDGAVRVASYGPPSDNTSMLVRTQTPGAEPVLQGPPESPEARLQSPSRVQENQGSRVAPECDSRVLQGSPNPLTTQPPESLQSPSPVSPHTPSADTRSHAYTCEDGPLADHHRPKPWHRPPNTIDPETGEITGRMVGDKPWRRT